MSSFIVSAPRDGRRAHGPRESQGARPRPRSSGLDLSKTFLGNHSAFLEQPRIPPRSLRLREADETFDTGFDDDDQFAETGGFYDIKGSDDESSQEDKKKKKKKDKKKKKKSSSRLNPDHEDPFYIGGGHVRPGDVSVDDVPVVRLSKKELKNDKKEEEEEVAESRSVSGTA